MKIVLSLLGLLIMTSAVGKKIIRGAPITAAAASAARQIAASQDFSDAWRR
jgi:hypothetical protein